MFGSGYQRESRNLIPQSGHRMLSPRTGHRHASPRLLERLASPQLRENEASNISEFINQIQNQVKRVSTNFSFQFSSEPPLVQAVSFLAQAIDVFLQEKRRSPRNSSGFEEHDSSESSRKAKEENEKNKETIRNLTRYEQLLKKKEEKLENEKNKLASEKNSIKDIEAQLRNTLKNFEEQEKTWNETKKNEFQRINEAKEEADKKLYEARDMKEKIDKKIDETTRHLKHEKESLVQLELCLTQTKQSLIADQKKITQEKLEIEEEKWKLDQRQRKLEEAETLFQVKNKHFEQQKVNFDSESSKIVEKNEFRLQVKEKNQSERESRLSQARSPNEEYGAHSRSGYQDYEVKLFELEEREKEIEQAYLELQEQMDNFNRELEEREIILEEREISVEKQERELKRKYENFQMIESSLIESKIQVEDLRTYTIPELEKQSEILESLMEELHERKLEAENIAEKLFKEVAWIEKEKETLEVIPESASIRSSRSSPDKELELLTEELENRLLKVKEKEEELEYAQAEVEKEREEIIITAEYLKKTHTDAELQRKKQEKEIAQERESLKSKFLKLESGMKLLADKEAEVFAFKRKLDEKSQMLSIKESHKKADSYGSSIIEEKE